MPMFVHLADEKDARRIKTGSLKGRRAYVPATGGSVEILQAIYCMPVLPNFHLTYQWLRELKRRGHRTAVGLYFRLPSDEPVWVGHFNQPHRLVGAGEAVKIIMDAADAEGWQIVLPHRVSGREIVKVRALPQTVGWRYCPKSHQQKPTCSCPYCLPPGSIKSRRLRERLEKESS